jgi:hypothetical protein
MSSTKTTPAPVQNAISVQESSKKRRRESTISDDSSSAIIQELKINKGVINEAVPVRKVITPIYPPELFRLHTLAAFFGPRGSGKTNGAVLLAQKYIEYGSFTRIYIISPTYESNPVFEVLNVLPDDVYTDIGSILEAIKDIVNKIEADALAYESELAYAELWLKAMKGHKLEPREQITLEREAFREPDVGPRPYPLVIIDDCSHSQIYSTSRSNPFINLCLRHRHIGGEGYGCSIFMLVQNFKTGVPKPIRQNLQQFFIWRTADRSQLEAMWEEFANLIDLDSFVRLYHLAVDADRHNFMTVDMNPSSDDIGNFRRNFDVALKVVNQDELIRHSTNRNA